MSTEGALFAVAVAIGLVLVLVWSESVQKAALAARHTREEAERQADRKRDKDRIQLLRKLADANTMADVDEAVAELERRPDLVASENGLSGEGPLFQSCFNGHLSRVTYALDGKARIEAGPPFDVERQMFDGRNVFYENLSCDDGKGNYVTLRVVEDAIVYLEGDRRIELPIADLCDIQSLPPWLEFETKTQRVTFRLKAWNRDSYTADPDSYWGVVGNTRIEASMIFTLITKLRGRPIKRA